MLFQSQGKLCHRFLANLIPSKFEKSFYFQGNRDDVTETANERFTLKSADRDDYDAQIDLERARAGCDSMPDLTRTRCAYFISRDFLGLSKACMFVLFVD